MPLKEYSTEKATQFEAKSPSEPSAHYLQVTVKTFKTFGEKIKQQEQYHGHIWQQTQFEFVYCNWFLSFFLRVAPLASL